MLTDFSLEIIKVLLCRPTQDNRDCKERSSRSSGDCNHGHSNFSAKCSQPHHPAYSQPQAPLNTHSHAHIQTSSSHTQHLDNDSQLSIENGLTEGERTGVKNLAQTVERVSPSESQQETDQDIRNLNFYKYICSDG